MNHHPYRNRTTYNFGMVWLLWSTLVTTVMMILCSLAGGNGGFVIAYDNGLGLTPPMGWNSWNRFFCDISEELIQEIALAMVNSANDGRDGVAKFGYQYVNLDDCWQHSRNSTGYIQADPSKFPSGISDLSDYIHSLGLKFGLYSDAGIKTCAGRPGSLGYERQDAASYKEWNVDYLKYDNCFNVGMNLKWRYQRMHDALNESDHAIFFSMCEWGFEDPATWAKDVGNSWRTTGDIGPSWKSITELMDLNNHWHDFAGPGGWNDPDMLEVGNGQLTIPEQRSHFTMWALMKSPLLLGNDIRTMDKDVYEIITNTEVIAWNQDPLGIQGYKRSSIRVGTSSYSNVDDDNDDDDQLLEVWAGELIDQHLAVVLLNRSDRPANITAEWKDLGLLSLSTSSGQEQPKMMYVRNVWTHEEIGSASGSITALVDSHDVVALELRPVEKDDETRQS